MMASGYVEGARYGVYVGTVTVDGLPLSDREKQCPCPPCRQQHKPFGGKR
jgi:hypothetical protein